MCVVCMSTHHVCVCVLRSLNLRLQTVLDSGCGCWELNSASPHFLCNGLCSTSSRCYTHCQVFLLSSLFNPGASEVLQMAAPCLKHKTAAQRLGKRSVGGACPANIKTRVQTPSSPVNAGWAWKPPYNSSILQSGEGRVSWGKLATQTCQLVSSGFK